MTVQGPGGSFYCTALLDTGANASIISHDAVVAAGLVPTAPASWQRGTVSGQSAVYSAAIVLPKTLGMLSDWPVIESGQLPDPEGFHVVLGMDLFLHCVFTVNVAARFFRIVR